MVLLLQVKNMQETSYTLTTDLLLQGQYKKEDINCLELKNYATADEPQRSTIFDDFDPAMIIWGAV